RPQHRERSRLVDPQQADRDEDDDGEQHGGVATPQEGLPHRATRGSPGAPVACETTADSATVPAATVPAATATSAIASSGPRRSPASISSASSSSSSGPPTASTRP